MISVFWGTLAYVLFPTACFSLFLMLSNIHLLERAGCAVCCADVQLGQFRCNVLVFCVILSCVGFLQSHFGVEKYEKLRNGAGASKTENAFGETIIVQNKDATLDDRYKLQLFRDQRNWWISLCNLVLWITCWRVQSIMRWKQAGGWGGNGGNGGNGRAAGGNGGSDAPGAGGNGGAPGSGGGDGKKGGETEMTKLDGKQNDDLRERKKA